jgi:uncharacterized membrane protein YdjX (TVP38/TMEM64 family)
LPVKKSLVIKIIFLAAFVFFILIAQFFWDISSYFNPDNIKRLLTAAGSFAPLLFMLVMAAAVVISPIPSLPLDVAAGVVFGPFLGTLYAVLGALGGSIISFMITRKMGRELIEPFLGGFCLATFLGMLPLTFVYTYFGSTVLVGKGLGISLGFIVVVMFFMIPWLIERYDLFSMRSMFKHASPQKPPGDEDRMNSLP